MREIKFRFRIKEDKGKQVGYVFFSLEELLKPNILQDSGYVILSRDEYTDLKDKNGVEIYEGDIVKIDRDFLGSEKDDVCQIEWAGGCCYQIESDEAGTFSLADFYESDLEVIGNIYENPELLERK